MDERLQRIADQINKPKWKGDTELTGCCPCSDHEDKNPSFRAWLSGEGWLNLRCYSKGCSEDALLSAVGLARKDKAPPKTEVMFAGKPRQLLPTLDAACKSYCDWKNGTEGGRWDFNDSDGTAVAHSVRVEWTVNGEPEKEVYPIAPYSGPEGTGYLMARPPGLTPPLYVYDYPEFEPIMLVEGEKTCDAARKLGFSAITILGGSSAAAKTDWSMLAGRTVWICPDYDEPGEKFANHAADLLSEVGSEVKIVHLPHVNEADDIANLVKPEMNAQELADLAASIRDQAEATDVYAPAVASSTELTQMAGGVTTTSTPAPTASHLITRLEIPQGSRAGLVDNVMMEMRGHYYHRNNMLVHIAQPQVEDGLPQIITTKQENVVAYLDRSCFFYQMKRMPGGQLVDLACPCPKWLGQTLVHCQEWEYLDALNGIATGPFLRRDGSVGGKVSGYDSASGIYVETDTKWNIPDHPTREQAKASAGRLCDLLDEFPFVDRAMGESVFLSALLTVVGREAIKGPTPMFVFDASCPGSGKGLMAKTIACIATGKPCDLTPMPVSSEEMNKTLTTQLTNGKRLHVFDNVATGLSDPVLDSFLTAPSWSQRRFGKNDETLELQNKMVLICTVNNASVTGDTVRRSIALRLEPDVADPHNRSFNRDLVAYVDQHRPELLVDALTVLRWHAVNKYECPTGNDGKPLARELGSFESWSKVVQFAVVALGYPDPVATQELLQDGDNPFTRHEALLEAIYALKESKQFTQRDIVDEAFKTDSVGEYKNNSEEYENLRLAISECTGVFEGTLDRKTFNYLKHQMREMLGRWHGPYKLVKSLGPDGKQLRRKQGHVVHIETRGTPTKTVTDIEDTGTINSDGSWVANGYSDTTDPFDR